MANADRVYNLIKLLLFVAREEGAEVIATKLQKIFFLLEKEGGVDLGLEFKPWFFGPYSERLQDYLDKLIEIGDVDVKEEEIRDGLTKEVVGHKRTYVLVDENFKPSDESDVMSFFRTWIKKSRHEILSYVYEKYPEYSRYSLIRDKILGALNG
ncbi:hypothetical protein [Metallosphaera hakonensis]|uniref:Conjugal transfer protein n=1 Tax=Metallosphaera hakonensis JCM 8857 = DSM 7519 TaxID=1293036 RepID=A0A2U9ISR9_9CREN|nr:hypothetical protein [Metallosphaera hakonensis]AWR99064.1 conjugal transfer protein [Metallosphaera hakonensis JCM 8857 = DSM 7519]